jgi:magnesium-transporting ATPase (P-type)
VDTTAAPALDSGDAGRAGGSGLTGADAHARLARDGPNELPPPPRRPTWRRFADQLVHFFALMLWCAAVLAFLARLPQLGVAIIAEIVVNGIFAFIQEARADQAAARLKALLPRRVSVRRDGRLVEIESRDVVVGDLLMLGAGDRIPADADAATVHALLVDTSLLTGESDPQRLEPGERLFAGTFVVEGEAEAVVTETGVHTRLADIAHLTAATVRPDSPLTRELERVVRLVARIAVSVGGLFFVVSTLLGRSPSDGFVFAIGVTVALVPEALLPTVTLSLAWGAEQMAKRRVLVHRLDSVETLGSTTFICTDKTGTLTRNEMTVVVAWTPSGSASTASPGYDPTETVDVDDDARPAVERLAAAAIACSDGYVVAENGRWVARGDRMEAAIDVLARRLGMDAPRHAGAASKRFPFDPRRRRMSVVLDDDVFVKGAAETVLPLCRNADAAVPVVAELTKRALRVLAVATRAVVASEITTSGEAERDLELVGLLGFEDPPRTGVRESIESCRRAGIKVAMITGDHPSTALAIANEVGLALPGAPVVVGDDLPDGDAELGVLLDEDGAVVARVSPEAKLRIAQALRARGHVLAMTGDGVNDGPALREADIGIAMGASGTDVAREAADMVLLDDHFGSIVAGIEQGRATYLNVRRFLTYHLTDNVAELTPFVVWALSGGSIPLALGVMQILALDIGTDTFSAVALGAEPPTPAVLHSPPVSGRLMNRTVLVRAFARLGPTEAAFVMGAYFVALAAQGWRPGDSFPDGHVAAAASGAAFMTVVIAQTANAFACRSATRRPGQLGWTSNRLLVAGASIELAIALVALLVPVLADQFDHANPPVAGWLVAITSAAAVLVVDALGKRRRRGPRSLDVRPSNPVRG